MALHGSGVPCGSPAGADAPQLNHQEDPPAATLTREHASVYETPNQGWFISSSETTKQTKGRTNQRSPNTYNRSPAIQTAPSSYINLTRFSSALKTSVLSEGQDKVKRSRQEDWMELKAEVLQVYLHKQHKSWHIPNSAHCPPAA